MPKIVLPVPENMESVTRPVVLEVTREIFALTGLSPQTNIYFPGDADGRMQPGTSIGDTDEGATFAFNDKMTVEVEEQYEADRMLSTAIYRPENLFIFNDDRIETSIKPGYSSTEITINFKYRAKDRATGDRWRDDIRARISMMRDERIFNVSYHYLIPEEFLVILKEIHRLRETVAGYGETWEDYFKANSTSRLTELTNLNASQKALAIAETQMRIVGWFDFDPAPSPGSKEDDGDTHTVTFAYKFRYDKPIVCIMQYPLMIHNQMLGSGFRPTEQPDRVEAHMRSYSLSAKNFSVFEKGHQLQGLVSQSGVAIPHFDEFIPASVLPSSIRVVTVLANIDTTDPRTLFSYKQLGDWIIDPDVLAFMAKEAPFLTKSYQSIFCVHLYQNHAMIVDGVLDVDSELTVRSTQDLPLRSYYHVRLGLVTDLSLITGKAVDRLRDNGVAAVKILDAIDPTLKDQGLLPDLLGGSYIKRVDMTKAIDHINRVTLSRGDGQIRQFNTVATLFLQASLN